MRLPVFIFWDAGPCPCAYHGLQFTATPHPGPRTPMEKRQLSQDVMLLVCTGKDGKCAKKGAKLRHVLRDEVHRLGLGKRIRVLPTGCLGACGKGPVALTTPTQTLWTRIRKRDARKLIAELAATLSERNERKAP